MIVRDLLVEPKRFTDLHRGLARIPTNILTARLKELEDAGVVQRRIQPRPATGVVYELTPYGRELEPVVIELGRWGAKNLGTPREGERVTSDSLVTALRTTFVPQAAQGINASYELRLGDIIVNADVRDGRLNAQAGPADKPDLIIETGPALRALFAGDLTPDDALQTGAVHLNGNADLFEPFAGMFRIEPMPSARA